MKKLLFMSLSLIIMLALSYSILPKAKAQSIEMHRFRPGTCTKVDEEGSYDVAICEKKVTNGPCIDEVTCENGTPVE